MTPGSLVGAAFASLFVVAMAQGSALAEDLSGAAPAASKAASEVDSLASEGARARFRWPVRGRILQAFKSGANDGIDIAAPTGEAVHAAADGVVTYARDEFKSYGNPIVIRHADGYVTVYAESSEPKVAEGDKVKRGQIIAKSGQSGSAATPRLHFELRKDGKSVDPTKQLAPM
jgi:murein DD-endopeptidase MepM/ murein hydrolase activator NlpD